MKNPARQARSPLLPVIPSRIPANRRRTDGDDLRVAAGRDRAGLSPAKGTDRGTAKRQLAVDVLVSRMEEIVATRA